MANLAPTDFFALAHFEHAALFDDCAHVWTVLTRIQAFLQTLPLGEIAGDVSEDAYLVNPEQITVEVGAVIEPGAYVKGPCWIGKGTVIRHGAYVRGNVLTGRDCVIGHATEVKNSVFLNKAQAAHFAYVGDSVLGSGVNLGAGTRCANLRLDGGNVIVRINGERHDTELRKFGAILGDEVQTGCNAVLNPGTLLGPKSRCYPCVNIGGYHPPKTTLKGKR